jgi:hypothetical protein
MDLQCEFAPNYNASRCVGDRKSAGAGTMGNNDNNNAENNETVGRQRGMKKPAEAATSAHIRD